MKLRVEQLKRQQCLPPLMRNAYDKMPTVELYDLYDLERRSLPPEQWASVKQYNSTISNSIYTHDQLNILEKVHQQENCENKIMFSTVTNKVYHNCCQVPSYRCQHQGCIFKTVSWIRCCSQTRVSYWLGKGNSVCEEFMYFQIYAWKLQRKRWWR